MNTNIIMGFRSPEIPDYQEAEVRRTQLAGMRQQQQAGAMQLQAQQQELEQTRKDDEITRAALMESGGNMLRMRDLIAQRGGSPKAVATLEKQIADGREAFAKASQIDIENDQKRTAAVASAMGSFRRGFTDEQTRAANWQALRADQIARGVVSAESIPEQYPGEQWLAVHEGLAIAAKDMADQELRRRGVVVDEGNAAETARRNAATEAQAAAALAETGRHNTTMEAKPAGDLAEFKQVFLPGWYASKKIEPNAASEMEAYREFQTAKRVPVPGVDVPLSRDVEAQRGRMAAAGKTAESRAGNPQLAKVVMEQPQLFDQLTATQKGEIAEELGRNGFVFGKPLAESAITKMAETRSAMASLKDLRTVLQENEQYIGPISGLAALNPYSDARKAQARIDLVKQRVGKALEGGVLRKEDEEKYKKILATLQDTPSTAFSKVDGLIQTLERDLDIFIEGQRAAGRRVNAPGAPNQSATPAGGGRGGRGVPAGGGMVKLRAPDGSTREVPADQAEHYISLGAKRVL